MPGHPGIQLPGLQLCAALALDARPVALLRSLDLRAHVVHRGVEAALGGLEPAVELAEDAAARGAHGGVPAAGSLSADERLRVRVVGALPQGVWGIRELTLSVSVPVCIAEAF
jgi:hypothetical protein